MDNYKKWTRIVLVASNVIVLVGMFLPWLVTSGYGQTDTKNVFDAYFDPTKWVLLVGIIVDIVFTILALVAKKDGLCKASGIIGIIMCVIMLGAIGVICLGQSRIGSYASSYGIQENFGVGFYVSSIAILATFVFSIVSLKAKK